MAKILYVDDDKQLRTLFLIAASRAGHDCLTVADGRAGLELIETGEKFDLIVSDNDMADMNGIELLQLVRNNPATADIPFVLFTGNDSMEVQEEMKRLKALPEDKASTTFPKILAKYLPQS